MARKSNKTRADGRIAVQVYLGLVDGKRKYKTVYGKTQKEADNKALDLKIRMGLGVDILNENTPFKEYRQLWLSKKKSTASQSYYKVCEGYSNALTVFDSFEIKKLQEHHIQAFINELAECNPYTKKPTAHKTLAEYKAAISQILQIAIKQGAITKDVTSDIVIPSSAPKNKRNPLSDEQIKWVEDTPHRAQTYAMIMLYSGLRRGELLALTWSDINLTEKTITVNKAVEMIGGKPRIKDFTKTPAGMRTVYIPQKLVDYLSKVEKNSILVAPNTSGEVAGNNSWCKLWTSYMRDLNIKYGKRTEKVSKFMPISKNPIIIKTFTAHQLRHTFATMLYKSGVDMLTAREQLGHSDINTTLKIYTHLDNTFKKKVINKLDNYLDNIDKCKSCASQENGESVDGKAL